MRIPSIECGHIPVFFKPQPFWPSCLFTTPRGTRLVPMRRRPVASPVRQSSLADLSFLDVKVIEELLQRLPDHLREQAKEDLQRRLNPDSRQRLGTTCCKCLGKKHKSPFLTPMLVFATWMPWRHVGGLTVPLLWQWPGWVHRVKLRALPSLLGLHHMVLS